MINTRPNKLGKVEHHQQNRKADTEDYEGSNR